MTRSLKIILALCLIALTNVYVDCNKNLHYFQAPQHYYYEPLGITPYNLNYNVGDTVWLHVSLPGKMLYDTLTHQTMRYDSGYFGTNATVQLLYNNPFITDGTPFASFVYTPGITANETTTEAYTTSTITFGCDQVTDYELKVGIVFKQKGVYGLSLSGTLQKCYSNLYVYNQIGFYFTVPDAHANFYSQLPFGSISQQEDFSIESKLNAKTMVCVNVQ